MLDCPDPNLVSPTDSGKNTVKLTQEGVECRQNMVKSKKKKRTLFCSRHLAKKGSSRRNEFLAFNLHIGIIKSSLTD